MAKAIVLLNEVSQQYAEESTGRIQDGRLYTGDVDQTHIEEYILQSGLGQPQQGKLASATSAQSTNEAPAHPTHDQAHQARQKQAKTDKHHRTPNPTPADGQ